ncbi:DNA polymerase III, beta subunit [Peptostreptococcaceae bacterium oral taxon 113 str. W5053]|nr:DNA polymerase III, beta subunit [Peptostreptococcaceae bacterium oral taxon 113 str. W5053]
MKLSIQQKNLLKHINIAQRAIGTHTTLPVLEGIYLIAKDNTLELIATDLKISIHSKVDALVKEEGEIIVNSNLFGNIIRKLPDEIVELEANDNLLQIKCAYSSFSIHLYEEDEYPSIFNEENGDMVTISSGSLKDSISQTVFATSQELTKPILTGVLMNQKSKKIDFVALDGYRIAIKTLMMEKENEKQVIIPAKALQELNRILPEEGDTLIKILKGSVVFEFEGTRLFTRLLDGNFIQYETVIESVFSTYFSVNRKSLEESIERAALLSREERTNLIKLDLNSGRLTITSNTEIGHVTEIVDGKQEGENLIIAFNARYLMEGIKAMRESEIKMKFSGPLRACIIEELNENPDFIYVVLPVKLAE